LPCCVRRPERAAGQRASGPTLLRDRGADNNVLFVAPDAWREEVALDTDRVEPEASGGDQCGAAAGEAVEDYPRIAIGGEVARAADGEEEGR
jgi:hypothetical protein